MSETKQTAGIRWMIRRDFPSVLSLDQWGTVGRWDELEFREALRDARTIGIVAEVAGQVVGYAVYTLTTAEIILHRLVVHCDHTRQGIGRLLLARITRHLTDSGRRVCSCRIPVWNDGGRAFLESAGWVFREPLPAQMRFEYPG